MLDSIRRRRNNFIFSGIIIVTAIVMIGWGAGKAQNESAGGAVAAWVNGEAITRLELDRAYQARLYQYQAMLGGQYDEKLLSALQIPQRTLDELIQYKLLAQEAERMKIRVPDVELAASIRSNPYYQKDGKFDRATYDKIPNKGREESRQREQLKVSKLHGLISGRVRLTPEALKTAYLIRDTKIDIDFAKISMDTLGAKQTPTPAQVADFIKTAPPEDLKKYYESHVKDFSEPAQVELSKIRVGIPFQAKPEVKAEAKKKIDALAKEVTPANFAEVAKAKSDDENAKNGGLVGWVKRGTQEAALEDALDKLKPGTVSAPVETAFGYYLLKVSNKKDQVTKSFDEVKQQVGSKLAAESLKKKWADEKQKQWEKMLAEGKSIESELKALKIDVKKTGPFSLSNGYIPQIGQSDAILDAVAQLNMQNPVAKKLVPHQEDLYYVKLRSVEFPKTADLAKQRETVEKAATTSYQGELLSQWVRNIEKTATIKRELVFKTEAPGADVD